MWIADQWKDYQVLDTSKGGKTGTLGRLSAGSSGPAGYLGQPRRRIRAGKR